MAKGKPVQEVVLRPLSDLKPNPKNPRRSDPEGLENLKDSISRNPHYSAARPILLSDRTGELVIIAGERRSEAAAALGMTEVPTILLSGLTEEQEDEIMVRDNVHNGLWNDVKLAELAAEWGDEKVKGWAPHTSWMPLVSDAEVADIFARAHANGRDKPDFITIEVPRHLDIAAIRATVIEAVSGYGEVKVR